MMLGVFTHICTKIFPWKSSHYVLRIIKLNTRNLHAFTCFGTHVRCFVHCLCKDKYEDRPKGPSRAKPKLRPRGSRDNYCGSTEQEQKKNSLRVNSSSLYLELFLVYNMNYSFCNQIGVAKSPLSRVMAIVWTSSCII